MDNNIKGKNGSGKKSQNWDFDYAACPQEAIFNKLTTSIKGLTEQEAQSRLESYG